MNWHITVGNHIDELVSACSEFMSNVKVIKVNNRSLYILAYYCRIIDLTMGLSGLLRVVAFPCIPILYRSIHEAWLDLGLFDRDDNYLNIRHKEHLLRYRDVLMYAKDHPEGIMQSRIVTADAFADVFNSIEQQIQEFEKKNVPSINIYQKHEKLGIVDIYKSIYAMLCQDSHNDPKIINLWNIESEETTHSVCHSRPATLSEAATFISLLPKVIDTSTQILINLADVDTSSANCDQLFSASANLRRFLHSTVPEP